jgi:hypothetical protein
MRSVVARARVRPTCRRRRGQALLEFAFVTVIVIFLIGGALALGHFFYSAQALQQAVDVAAQEIARMPLGDPTRPLGLGDLDPPEQAVMFDAAFQQQIYDERHLIIRPADLGGLSFAEYVNGLPLLNRLLAGVMIFDPAFDGGVYRYPGAIVRNTVTGVETVLIPLVRYDADGAGEVYEWLAPVEEMRVEIDGVPTGPFSLLPPPDAPAEFTPGMVALRINYPAQAAGLIGRNPQGGAPIVADEPLETEPLPTRYELVVDANDPSQDFDGSSRIHAGPYGLGKQAALWRAQGVRPYRKVLSVQAVYRREVFE